MNREKAIRKGICDLLNGVLYTDLGDGSFNVPVYDSKIESTENVYVIISNQFSIYDGDFTRYRWKSTIEIDIFHTQQNSATNDIVDDICEQIESLLLNSSTPIGSGIIQQDGWKITNVTLSSVSNIRIKQYQGEAGIIANKNLQFNFIISKIN